MSSLGKIVGQGRPDPCCVPPGSPPPPGRQHARPTWPPPGQPARPALYTGAGHTLAVCHPKVGQGAVGHHLAAQAAQPPQAHLGRAQQVGASLKQQVAILSTGWASVSTGGCLHRQVGDMSPAPLRSMRYQATICVQHLSAVEPPSVTSATACAALPPTLCPCVARRAAKQRRGSRAALCLCNTSSPAVAAAPHPLRAAMRTARRAARRRKALRAAPPSSRQASLEAGGTAVAAACHQVSGLLLTWRTFWQACGRPSCSARHLAMVPLGTSLQRMQAGAAGPASCDASGCAGPLL